MTRVIVIECEMIPLVPVIVNLKVPEVALLQAPVSFKVDVPEPVTVAGVKVAVTPAGSPLTLRATAPVNPPDGVTVMV